MTWRAATMRYIENYQRQRMRPLSGAPPTTKLAAEYNILETRLRNVSIARHGYYLPKQKSDNWNRKSRNCRNGLQSRSRFVFYGGYDGTKN